jgi:hypothetical protein
VHSIDSTGLWYLPDSPNEQVAGTLRFSPQGGITLSLTGTLRTSAVIREAVEYPIIHGVIADSPYPGKMVTLVGSFQRRGRFTIPGFESEEIRANRAYIGSDYVAGEEQARFASIRASYVNLAEWSSLTGFRNFEPERDDRILTARYEPPLPIELWNDGQRHLQIEVDGRATTGGRRFEISERVELTLSDAAGFMPQPVLREIVFPFGDFLTFAVDRPSPVDDVVFLGEQAGHRRPSFNLLFEPVYRAREDQAFSRSGMLFGWDDIRHSHPDVIQRWFRLRSRFKVALDVYFGLLYGPPLYLETRFHLLLTALSRLLAGRTPDEPIRGALDTLRHATQDSIGERWLDMLPGLDHLCLPQNLSAFLDRYRELAPGLGGDADSFVTSVADMQRRLFDDEDTNETRSPVRLLRIVERLTLVAKIAILEHLGFSHEEIVSFVSQHPTYPYLTRQRP